MECAQNLKLCHLCCSLSFLFFFILSSPQFRFTVEGKWVNFVFHFKTFKLTQILFFTYLCFMFFTRQNSSKIWYLISSCKLVYINICSTFHNLDWHFVLYTQLVEDDEKSLARGGHIGSSPPRCDRRCSSCGHCEAIQVPTNPSNNNSSTTVAYARGDQDSSNYKPMSWKCKCGKFIFDPWIWWFIKQPIFS